MSDEYTKARDVAADQYIQLKKPGCSLKATTFEAGSDWGRAYEQGVSDELLKRLHGEIEAVDGLAKEVERLKQESPAAKAMRELLESLRVQILENSAMLPYRPFAEIAVQMGLAVIEYDEERAKGAE